VVVEFCEAADGVGLCGTGRSRILIAVAFVGFTLMQLIERATYQSYMLLVGSRFLSRIENNLLRKMPFYFLSVYC
jgi:hypothetical protein